PDNRHRSIRRLPCDVNLAAASIGSMGPLLLSYLGVELPRHLSEGAFERETPIKVAAADHAIRLRRRDCYGRGGLRSFRRGVGLPRSPLAATPRTKRGAGRTRQADNSHAQLGRQRAPRPLLDRRRRPGLLRCELRAVKQETNPPPASPFYMLPGGA